jgi:hypothetical protein
VQVSQRKKCKKCLRMKCRITIELLLHLAIRVDSNILEHEIQLLIKTRRVETYPIEGCRDRMHERKKRKGGEEKMKGWRGYRGGNEWCRQRGRAPVVSHGPEALVLPCWTGHKEGFRAGRGRLGVQRYCRRTSTL